MITVNGESMDHTDPMTVTDLLKARNFIFPLLVVKIDGQLVPRDAYPTTPIRDHATVEVIHLMSGG